MVPPTFYAAGLNYAEHVREAAEKLGLKVELPTQADAGYRANNALIAHGENHRYPEGCNRAGAVRGRAGRRDRPQVQAPDAGERTFGCPGLHDRQRRERADLAEERPHVWRAKNTDTFKPMGPWIETDVKLDDLVTRVRLNGKELIAFPTNHMVFGVVDFLVSMTRYLTLYPGDVLWMGTEGATAEHEARRCLRNRDQWHRHVAQSGCAGELRWPCSARLSSSPACGPRSAISAAG